MRNVREFGPALKVEIQKAGLNQAKLADLIGCKRATISLYVHGTSVPILENLRKLDTVFPGLLDTWEGIVKDYHEEMRKARIEKVRAANARKREEHRNAVGQALERPRMAKRGPAVSIGEICRRAKEKGLTYGEYVEKYCGGG